MDHVSTDNVGAVRAQQLSDVEVEVAAEWLNTYNFSYVEILHSIFGGVSKRLRVYRRWDFS
jgi:hypothetical protein